MTARKRTGLLSFVLAIFFAVNAFAIPIKPNLEKILQEQQQPPRHYEPARAGWDGPEMVRPQDASPNPVYEAYGPASTARAIRASLKAAATPDPAAMASIGMLIVLWRIARNQRQTRERAVATNPAPSPGIQETKAA